MSASTLARSARSAAGVTQTLVARRSGVASSSLSLIEHARRDPTVETLESILAASGFRLVLIPTTRSDAADIAIEIKEALAHDDDARAFRRFLQLNDNLRAEHGSARVGLTLTEPVSTGHAGWDGAVAAVCALLLDEEQLPVPAWVDSPSRQSASEWTLSSGRYRTPVDRSQVPAPFLERGVLVESATLESV